MIDTSSIQKTIQSGLEGALKDLQTEATNLVSSSLGDIAASFPEAASFFNKTNPVTVAANIDKNKGPKETEHKVKSLAADSAEAVSNPVAFITKPIDDVVKSVDTTTLGKPLTDALGDMSSVAVDNISKATNMVIESSSDLMEAVNKVTDDFATELQNNSFVDSITSTVEEVTSTASDFAGTVMSGVESALDTATNIVEEATDVINMDFLDDITDSLPSPLNDMVQTIDDTITSGVDGLIGDKLDSVSNILGQLQGVTSTENILNAILNLGESTLYSMLTNEKGESLTSSVGSNSSNTVNKMYDAAATICSEIKSIQTIDYQKNKDLFDTILQLSIDFGMTDLLKKLTECPGSGNDYYDSRSETLAKNKSSSVALSGNTEMYKTLQQLIGPYNIPNPVGDLSKLIANSSGGTQNKNNIVEISTASSISIPSLYQVTELNNNIISTDMVSLLSANNTEILNDYMDEDTRKLVLGAQMVYA